MLDSMTEDCPPLDSVQQLHRASYPTATHRNDSLAPYKIPDTIGADILARAAEVGARLLVPTPEQDLPLSREVLTIIGESPVSLHGIDFTALVKAYLAEVYDQGENSDYLPPLAEIFKMENVSVIMHNVRILADHDSRAHRNAGFTKFEVYCESSTGKKMSRSTLFRRITQARVALVFATSGIIDLLPIQEQCSILGKTLPRCHWVGFMRYAHRFGNGKLSTKGFSLSLEHYAAEHDLPVVGEPPDSTSIKLPDRPATDALAAVVIPEPTSIPKAASPTHAKSQPSPVVMPERNSIPVCPGEREPVTRLEEALGFYCAELMDMSIEEEVQAARKFLAAMRRIAQNYPVSDLTPLRLMVLRLIAELNPDLNRALRVYSLSLMFDTLDQEFLAAGVEFLKVPENVPVAEHFSSTGA